MQRLGFQFNLSQPSEPAMARYTEKLSFRPSSSAFQTSKNVKKKKKVFLSAFGTLIITAKVHSRQQIRGMAVKQPIPMPALQALASPSFLPAFPN